MVAVTGIVFPLACIILILALTAVESDMVPGTDALDGLNVPLGAGLDLPFMAERVS